MLVVDYICKQKLIPILRQFFFISSCQRLGLTALGYLWRRNQEELLHEMIQCGVHAILIKVASLGKIT